MGRGLVGETVMRQKQETILIQKDNQQAEGSAAYFDREMTRGRNVDRDAYKGGPPLPVPEAPAKKRLSRSLKSETRQVPVQEEKEIRRQEDRIVRSWREQRQERGYAGGGDGGERDGQIGENRMRGKRVGELTEEERSDTYSDVQRKGFKRNLLDNVKIDKEAGFSRAFGSLLQRIEEYGKLDVTGDLYKTDRRELIFRERELLSQILSDLRKLTKDREKKKNSKRYRREWEVLSLYKGYFDLDTGGYMEIPEETPGERVHDCRNVEMKMKGIPLAMKEVPRDEPLFPHEPSINDIAQGSLGDCYLLSALSALVDKKPQWIKDCMRDNGDGSVTVRLYDWKERNSEGKWVQGPLVPHYITVSKRVPGNYEGQDEPFAKGALWVQMMEQAYVLSGFHDVRMPTDDYSSIAGGLSSVFLRRVTGQEREDTGLNISSDRQAEDLAMAMLDYQRRNMDGPSQGKQISMIKIQKRVLGVTEDSKEEEKLLSKAMGTYFDTFLGLNIYAGTVEDAQAFLNSFSLEQYRERELEKQREKIMELEKALAAFPQQMQEKVEVLEAAKPTIDEARRGLEALRERKAAIEKLLGNSVSGEGEGAQSQELNEKAEDVRSPEELKRELEEVNGLLKDANMKFSIIVKPERELATLSKRQEDAQNKLVELRAKEARLVDLKEKGWKVEEGKTERDELDRILGYEEQHFLILKKFYEEHGEDVLEHASFSGRYTERAVRVYEQIEEAQRQGKLQTASTRNNFLFSKGGGLNGEKLEDGLASSHAYTLMGVKEAGGYRYVKLRNPWSRVIRAYREGQGGKVERMEEGDGNHGIFLLELNEFMTRYDQFGAVG